MENLIIRAKKFGRNCVGKWYRRSIPQKVAKIRVKEKISVLFVLSETAKWKTESLYLAMLEHDRFAPVLGITLKTDDKPSESARKLLQLIDYLKEKKYEFHELIRADYIKNNLKPDIIIYQEPYANNILREFNYLHNLYALFISITYGFHNTLLPFNNMGTLKAFAWFDCYENESTANDAIRYIRGKRKNIVVTGLPMSEVLLQRENKPSIWKNSGNKKKIIWAPHHSVGFDYETITYSTFLMYADYIKDLAITYQDVLQWAFKPHPLLKYKLTLLWGKDKTEKYYNFWETQEFTQLEEGEYIDLFQQSDAMLHDCDSFTIEYLYMNNPVMYLNNGKMHGDLNSFAQIAYKLHVQGNNKADIKQFIEDVINGKDDNKGERTKFFEESLKTLYGTSASQNIINVILGTHEKIKI